jgi:hypothetical protein
MILPRRFLPGSFSPVTLQPDTPADACNIPVSSYSYSGKSKTNMNTNAITLDWSPAGEFMWIGLKIDRTALAMTGNTDWDVIDSRTSPHNYRYGFIPEVVSGGSVWSMLITTAPDGTPGGQMLLCLAFGLTFCEIAQYTMPIPYNLRQGNPPATSPPYYPTYTPVYVGSYDTTADTPADSINDMRMSPDGTRIIASISRSGGSHIIQWNLTTPHDVLGGMSYQPPVAMTGYDFTALYVPPSGECLYLGSSGTISQFTMSSAWEISTLNTTPVDTLDISSEFTGAVASIYVTENDLYALRSNAGDVFQYEI